MGPSSEIISPLSWGKKEKTSIKEKAKKSVTLENSSADFSVFLHMLWCMSKV